NQIPYMAAEIIGALGFALVPAALPEARHLSVAVEKRMVLPAELDRIPDDLASVIQVVGYTVIGAERADVDHLAAGVDEGAIRIGRESGVTSELPGGVDPTGLG